MLFTSPVFLFLFLPVVFSAYYLVTSNRRNILLFIASITFYAWGEVFYVLLLLASIGLNYCFGILIERFDSQRRKYVFLVLAISLNLLTLIVFKYLNFIVDNLNVVLKAVSLPLLQVGQIHLPLGISFFTFQAMSYVIDVYRGAVPVQKSFLNIALYVSLFPQLIAGPIVRYRDVAEQLIRRTSNVRGITGGIKRFIFGLSKKMLIANSLGELADTIFALPHTELSFGLSWLGIVCYSFQIYFDFSGYSDMAIGLARLFGFNLLENFNYPYISRSMREFWRRWHISLSNWFRDYLYISMGGSRCRPFRVYINLFVVFALCGIWHGASWNFLIWGLIHGLFLVLERIGFYSLLKRLPSVSHHIYVCIVVMVAWVFFRAETLDAAVSFLAAMAGLGEGVSTSHRVAYYVNPEIMITLVAAVLFSTPLPSIGSKHIALLLRNNRTLVWVGKSSFIIILFFFCTLYIASNTYNPFIYFRF